MKFTSPPNLVLIVLLYCAVLSGQGEAETDTTSVDTINWNGPVAMPIKDAVQPRLLYYSWDEWGHSDLATSTANPFVPSDLQIGSATLDGSLGLPVLAVDLAALTIPGRFRTIAEIDEQQQLTSVDNHTIALIPIPLNDIYRHNQTFLFWDQGDYVYKDVQVGGTVQVDETRNIMMAARGVNHPGQYNLAGPSAQNIAGNVLQNYLFDYRRDLALESAYNYTALVQLEEVGTPYYDERDSVYGADTRASKSWSHGVQVKHKTGKLALNAHFASLYNELTISTTVASGNSVRRTSLSNWANVDGNYAWSEKWMITGRLERKTRRINDEDLGHNSQATAVAAFGLARNTPKTVSAANILLVDDQLTWGGNFSTRLGPFNFDLRSAVSAYIPLPHANRRRAVADSLLADFALAASPIRNSVLTLGYSLGKGFVTLELGVIGALDDDQHNATTLAFMAAWAPWTDVLQVESSFSAVQSDAADMFPIVGSGQLNLRFTLPLKNRRARPFLALQGHVLKANFDQVYDPRYADYLNLAGAADRITQGAWLSIGGGIKTANFQLEFQAANVTQVTIPSSVILDDGTYYLGSAPLNHYSVSWRFLPEL